MMLPFGSMPWQGDMLYKKNEQKNLPAIQLKIYLT
jgi:hypothetical protein